VNIDVQTIRYGLVKGTFIDARVPYRSRLVPALLPICNVIAQDEGCLLQHLEYNPSFDPAATVQYPNKSIAYSLFEGMCPRLCREPPIDRFAPERHQLIVDPAKHAMTFLLPHQHPREASNGRASTI